MMRGPGIDAFSPALLRLQERPPSPLPRALLALMLLLCAALGGWSALGRLDVVAVAQGRLVPLSYVKVVQPADGGIVRDILVREGQTVRAGQVLARMDAAVAEADRRRMERDRDGLELQLRRIDAELRNAPVHRRPDDPEALWRETSEQHRAALDALADAVAAERAVLAKATHERAAAMAQAERLRAVLDSAREEESAWRELQHGGYAGRLQADEKRHRREEAERALDAQRHAVAAATQAVEHSERSLQQLASGQRVKLTQERTEARAALDRLTQELAKHGVHRSLLELRAPQDGVVKELATHTPGAVVAPGTVLMTLVPLGEALRAEVWVSNEDIGFVRPGQAVQLKLAAYPFHKYGLLEGVVATVSVDATEAGEPGGLSAGHRSAVHRYRALVDAKRQSLVFEGTELPLTAGMLVDAEMQLGSRSVLEYVLSPVRKAFREAGRER
jgi:HlyD family secretion protein